MENKTKAETFIGFAVRAGKFRSGTNTLSTLKKAYVILVCESAAENTLNVARKYGNKYRCAVLITKGVFLSEIAHKDGIKIAAVTDLPLAKAIIDNAVPNFTELSAANNTEKN